MKQRAITIMHIRITAVLLLAAAMLLGACRKYLEQAPDSTWTDLNTPAKVSKLLGTAYPQANHIAMCEAMTDNVSDKGIGIIDRANMDAYTFNDIASILNDSPEAYWKAAYAAIAAANQALKACNKPDSDSYRRQRGEALVARAYAHFMLVNLFSKSYDTATAATDPGIPYVTEPETVVVKQYDRKTVAYVYNRIEQDLLEGLPLINDDAYEVPHYHFNRSAAYAFATRFYLYKKDYLKVITYANLTFPNNDVAAHMRPWNTRYSALSPAQLFDTYANASEDANLLLVETPSLYGRNVGRYRFDMDYAHQVQILRHNVTGGLWCYPVYYYGSQDYLVPKLTEYFVKSSVNGTIGQAYVMVPVFTTEEVLFNRAEANTYLMNASEVLRDLNLFASKRIRNYNANAHTITLQSIRNYYGINDVKAGLLQTVLDFKRAEYAQEGMRWFDIMRYKAPVTHRTADGNVYRLKADDPHRVFQVPASAGMSGVAPNPR